MCRAYVVIAIILTKRSQPDHWRRTSTDEITCRQIYEDESSTAAEGAQFSSSPPQAHEQQASNPTNSDDELAAGLGGLSFQNTSKVIPFIRHERTLSQDSADPLGADHSSVARGKHVAKTSDIYVQAWRSASDKISFQSPVRHKKLSYPQNE
jgi:hypothetical protein